MRWATSALLAATLGTLTTGFAAEPAMFRADARHGGIYDAAGVAVLHGAKWTFRTGGAVISTPVVASGTVYFGSSDHNLYALDAASGALRWKFATGGRVTSSPAVAGGRVYFGSFDSNLYALDAASGALVWKFTTAGERRFSGKHLHGAEPAAEVMPDPFDVFLSSPVVVAGVVYFGSGDGNVYALDGASGALRWKFPTGNVVHASPALAAGTLYVGSWDSYFYALDAASGKQRWRFKTGEDPKINNQVGIQSSAVVADGVVYFGCRDSHLYALDAATGTQRWAFSTGASWVISSPAVRDGKVYFATSDSGLVQALDAQTGTPVFLYIGSEQGKLLAIDLTAQRLAWSFQTENSKKNGALYTNADGTPNYSAVYSDSFYDQLIIANDRMMSVGAVLSSPVVDGDTIYFGSWDGQLYAIG